MGQVNGNNPHINFGTHRVDVGKSNGVKRETIAGDDAKNSMKSIFNKYDTNKDGYLDNVELAKLYSDMKGAAGNNTLSQIEAKALAKQLGMQGIKRGDFQQFTEALAAENDGVSAQWDGNKYTVVDGNATTVNEYADDDHTTLSKVTVKNGNSTKITNYNEDGVATTRETVVSVTDMIASRQVDTYAEDGTIAKTEKYGPGGEKLKQEIKKDGDNTVITDFNDAGKPTKRTVKDPQGNETVTTIEYAADGSYTETTNGEVKHFNADGTAKAVEPETVVPESKQHKVQSGEYWYKIVQDEYGVTDRNTIMEIVHQLKDLAGPQYGKEVNYGSSSMPRELTLPTTIELKNGQKITLTNPPEGVAAAATPDAATEVTEVPGAERTEDPNSESSEDQNAGATQKQATPENIAALKTHLQSVGIQDAVVEQLEDGQVKVKADGKEYVGTIDTIELDIVKDDMIEWLNAGANGTLVDESVEITIEAQDDGSYKAVINGKEYTGDYFDDILQDASNDLSVAKEIKTQLQTAGIEVDGNIGVEQLEGDKVKVTVNGQEYTGTVEQIKTAIAATVTSTSDESAEEIANDQSVEEVATDVATDATNGNKAAAQQQIPKTFGQAKEEVFSYIDTQVAGVMSRSFRAGTNDKGETIYQLEMDGFSCTGRRVDEIKGKLEEFFSSLRTAESGAKFKIADNGGIICANATTMLNSNKDSTDELYLRRMDGSDYVASQYKHNTYLALSKVPEAEQSDAEKTFMQNYRQELNEKGYTVLSDGHIVDTKLHNMKEDQQIQIVPKDDGTNEIIVTKRGADGKIQTLKLKEEAFCTTAEKAEGLRASLATLYVVAEEPLQETATIAATDAPAATAGAAELEEADDAEEPAKTTFEQLVAAPSHVDVEQISERPVSEVEMIDYFSSIEGAQVEVIDNGQIKVTYKGETETFNVANDELDRFSIWTENIDAKLTPEERAAVVNGTYQGDKITVDGVTHYRYADCNPADLRTVDGKQLHKDAASAFQRMKEAAAADGVDLVLVSGMRGSKYQKDVFKRKFNNPNNPTEAEMNARVKYSAPSGFSEHHTGLAMDICSTEESFANTKEYQWLQAHAHEYGFELSFPQDNAQGLGYEPWHWRFVGTDEAREQFGDARARDPRFADEYFVG